MSESERPVLTISFMDTMIISSKVFEMTRKELDRIKGDKQMKEYNKETIISDLATKWLDVLDINKIVGMDDLSDEELKSFKAQFAKEYIRQFKEKLGIKDSFFSTSEGDNPVISASHSFNVSPSLSREQEVVDTISARESDPYHNLHAHQKQPLRGEMNDLLIVDDPAWLKYPEKLLDESLPKTYPDSLEIKGVNLVHSILPPFRIFNSPETGFHTISVLIPGGYEAKAEIQFQSGLMKDGKPTGVFMEDVIDILINQLEYKNQGDFKNEHNDIALQSLKAAKYALEERQRKRKEEGKLNTYEK